MGLVSWSLIFIPSVLLLAFLAGRQYHGGLFVRKRLLAYTWFLALLLVLGALFLPSYQWIDSQVSPLPSPFDAFYSTLVYLIPLLSLILATLLLFKGLTLIKKGPASADENIKAVNLPIQHTGRIGVTCLVFSGLLYGSSLYNLYYQFIWDSTTDPLDIFLLIGPLFVVLVSGMFLSGALYGRTRLYGLFYTLILTAGVVSVFIIAKRTDYYQLTETRAATVTRAVDAYYAREGRYPQSLRQLVPWTVVSLPKPVIMQGQEWCYQAGEGYYRLGYVSRGHWSSPYLSVRVYKSIGTVLDLPDLCKAETDAIIARESFYSVIR